jgi:HAD superfamily hydrolase (TIGR01509 family)
MRAILWDMDGTVLDSEPAHDAAFHGAIDALGLELPEGFHDLLLGASGDQVHAALVKVGLTLPLPQWTTLKAQHYATQGARITRRSPTAEIALALAARGHPMALVSNSTAQEVAMNLDVTGTAPAFAHTISRDDVAKGKPAPDGYLLAAQKLGVAPRNCIVVEDSPTGARAGLAAGMTVLLHPQTLIDPVAGALYLHPDASPEDMLMAFLTGSHEDLVSSAHT